MRKNVFMVMPFSDNVANNNYKHSIKPICDQFELDIRNASEIFTTNTIYEDIVKEIQDASIVLVDITGKNPNVFYELGMAHTLKQNRTIMVTQDDFEQMPFNISHFRIIRYENSIAGKEEFEKQLKATIENLLSDYKETFANEFELTIEIFNSSNNHNELLSLIGISKYKGKLNKNDSIELEGVYPTGESKSSSISIETGLKGMIKLGYVKFENDLVVITEKGKAFINVLKDKGFECNKFNDQVFKEGYIPVMERVSDKINTNESHENQEK